MLEQLGLTGDEDPAQPLGRRGAARGAGLRAWRPSPTSSCSTSRPTISTCRPSSGSKPRSRRSSRRWSSSATTARFLGGLTRATVWLDRGRTRRLDKGFSAFEAWRDTELEEEEKNRHKLDRQIVREEHWVRYGVTARRKRNVGRLERLAGLRQQKRDARRATGEVKIVGLRGRQSRARWWSRPRRSPRPMTAARWSRDFSTRIIRGDRIGVVGANGTGKTTLLKMLTGELAPDSGKVRLGSNIELASLDQRRAKLSPGLDAQGSADRRRQRHPDHQRPAQARHRLHAGLPLHPRAGPHRRSENSRAANAAAWRWPAPWRCPRNFLVLDEPTNDLDLETLDLLQEMLADYPGTVLVVSHDRDFLDRVATAVIVSEGQGVWTEYAGGYTDMVAQRGFGVRGPNAAPAKSSAKRQGMVATSAPTVAKPKMTFKDKHALETLPKEIELLEAKIAKLHDELADPKLYERDPKAFAEKSKALTAAEAAVAAAEERWLELEVMREELESR